MYFIAIETQNMGLRADQTQEKNQLTKRKKAPMKLPKIQKDKIMENIKDSTKALNDQL